MTTDLYILADILKGELKRLAVKFHASAYGRSSNEIEDAELADFLTDLIPFMFEYEQLVDIYEGMDSAVEAAAENLNNEYEHTESLRNMADEAAAQLESEENDEF